MDSWKEREIKAMQFGGNGKFNSFLSSHGVSKETPISAKYDSAPAELYKDIMSARLDGRPEPTELPVREKKNLEYESSFSPDFNSLETPYEREARLKREAQERLRAKFGAGGINNQAGGSHAWVNPEGNNSNNSSTDDYLASVTSTLSYWGTKTTEILKPVGEKVVTTVRDPKLVDNVKSSATAGWNTVVSTVTDPELTNNVKSYASTGWNFLSTTTGSLISQASTLIDSTTNGTNKSGSDSMYSSDSYNRGSAYEAPRPTPSYAGEGIDLTSYGGRSSKSSTEGVRVRSESGEEGGWSTSKSGGEGAYIVGNKDTGFVPGIDFVSNPDLPPITSLPNRSPPVPSSSPPTSIKPKTKPTPVGDDFFASLGAK